MNQNHTRDDADKAERMRRGALHARPMMGLTAPRAGMPHAPRLPPRCERGKVIE
jgi:hypothetical protein